MPALTAADREFLAQEWRFVETVDSALKERHPGAREIEVPSPFVTIEGATLAIAVIAAQLILNKRQIVVTVDEALTVSFKQRPPTCRIHHARFGGNLATGKLMLIERADVDHGARRTTFYLGGT